MFAAALGHSYSPQEDRGVFRTMNGGRTWEKVLFVEKNTGCGDMAMDPNNPRILFAGIKPELSDRDSESFYHEKELKAEHAIVKKERIKKNPNAYSV